MQPAGDRPGPTCPACGGHRFRHFARKGAYTYQQCRTCGLLAVDPLPSEAAIADHYRHKFAGGNYAAPRAFAEQLRRVHRQYAHWMARRTALRGARTLDVGCFTGELVRILVEECGADGYGVELQPEAVAIARTHLGDRVLRHDIDSPIDGLPDGSFDVVTLMAVIEHVKTPNQVISRARQLLKPGGWLFLETPNASSWPARLVRSYWPPLAPVEHLYLFSSRAMRSILARHGFRVAAVTPHVKPLPISYVREMLQHFGPEWRRLVDPVYRVLPGGVREMSAPFYVGEMLVAAQATAAGTNVAGHGH